MSDFKIIPVIDIMDGIAVHAKRGQRHDYRPVQSILCADSDPEHLIAGMVSSHPCPYVYVADLNAIMGRGAQTQLIDSLTPYADIWLDQGISSVEAALAITNSSLVVGSESLTSLDEWQAIKTVILDRRLILSLDFSPEGTFRGPLSLWENSKLWPSRVIVMTLARVGSSGGPDFEMLETVASKTSYTHIFAAGGVRDQEDLDALRKAGYAGALVATALHDGRIK